MPLNPAQAQTVLDQYRQRLDNVVATGLAEGQTTEEVVRNLMREFGYSKTGAVAARKHTLVRLAKLGNAKALRFVETHWPRLLRS